MTTVDTKPPCGPACCTYPCERAETVEAKARDALALFVERHRLPRPAGVRWDELGSVLTVSLGSDGDVDSWAVAMLREPWPQFAGRDDQALPGAWSVRRSYGYSVERWMGVGVALVVSHNESRVAHAPEAVTS